MQLNKSLEQEVEKMTDKDLNDWSFETLYRDFGNRPIGYPLLKLYDSFMSIKRYDRMPYYIAPVGTHVVDYEDRLLNMVDWMVDAHEEARNTDDKNRNFYQRSVYVLQNFMRYQNDTVCNIMFDTKASKPAYDTLNATITHQNRLFYLSTLFLHVTTTVGMSFYLRYRRIGAIPTVLIAAAYYSYFENANNILYKLIVDRKVIQAARAFGLEKHIQPTGTFKNRNIGYL